MSDRYLFDLLDRHLARDRQMVFLVGPRQVGKTTLAKELLAKVSAGNNYFNWDMREHRSLILDLFRGQNKDIIKKNARLVFDEIHKYKRWKNSLKGLFDVSEPHTHWVVTGSAGLNVYRRGQDSLLGRHFTYHLHPFTLRELMSRKPQNTIEAVFDHFSEIGNKEQKYLEALFEFGGFPEPLFKKDRAFLRLWRQTRLDRLLNQDLAQTENLRHLSLVEELMRLLPSKVGSILSFNSLREDLEVHFATAKNWIAMLERVFYGYLIRPFSVKNSRLVKKEPKWYLWDWTEVEDLGARFENMVANHLLKTVDFYRDTQGMNVQLHFVRDRSQNEVDFLLVKDRQPWILVECKFKEQGMPAAVRSFAKKLGVSQAFSLNFTGQEWKSEIQDGIRYTCGSAARFFAQLV